LLQGKEEQEEEEDSEMGDNEGPLKVNKKMESAADEVSSLLRLRRIATTKPDAATAVSSTNFSSATEEAAEEPPEEEPVTPCGRLFCEPNMSCYIMCILGFKNLINLPEFKQALKETLVKHKRFHSVMTKNAKGIDVWVATEVDIDAHVFEPSGFLEEDLAAPHFVEAYVADLASAPPMSFSRPLWACHILNGTSGDAAAHMVVRVHHSLGDGTSLMSLLLACTRRVDQPNMLPSVPAKRKNLKADPPFSLLSSLWKTLILVRNTMIGLSYYFATILWIKDSDTKIKGHQGVERAPKSLMYTVIDIDDMRLVKDAVNGTINDVLMGIIGAGLHQYLEGHHKDVANADDEPESRGKNTKTDGVTQIQPTMQNGVSSHRKTTLNLNHLRIRATALQNTRMTPGLQELVTMMEGGSQKQWGNRLGYLIFPISVKHFSDPLDHVRAAKRTSDRMKASLEGAFTYWSGALLMAMTGPPQVARLTEHTTLQTTMAVSNVPGPMEPVMFGGNPIVLIYPTAAGQPSVSIASHYPSTLKPFGLWSGFLKLNNVTMPARAWHFLYDR